MRTLLCTLALASFVSAAEPVYLTLADFTDTKDAAPSGGWTTEGENVIHLSAKAAAI
jgi:hypothetical protein